MSVRNKRLTHSDRVFNFLKKQKQPLTAYEILDLLRSEGITAATTVYRALDKLVEIGKIHKIESRNAFIACKNSKCQITKATVFSICENCEDVKEIHDHKLSEHLKHYKDNKGMKYSKYNLEFFGLCKKCIKN